MSVDIDSDLGSAARSGAGLDARIRVGREDGFIVDLSLNIPAGTTAALLGPNGAGKSTTVQVLAGLLPLDEGRITIGDLVVDDPGAGTFVPPEARKIGVVFQDYLLFENLSVADNVAFGLRASGLGRRAARAAAIPYLERLGLLALADVKPHELSGGQAQRVAIARALAPDPALLLLDEPLAAVDVATRTELRRSLAEYMDRYPGPRLLITHEPTDASILADRIYVIEDGTITQQGTADEIRRRPATQYVAAVAGTNLLSGHNDCGAITIRAAVRETGREADIGSGAETGRPAVAAAAADTGFILRTSDTSTGPVNAVIHPRAISLHPEPPRGSHRNVWRTTVEWIEPLGDTTRIQLGPPLQVVADITPSATTALDLVPGKEIWAAVKATEVSVQPA